MANIELLKSKIKQSRLSIVAICDESGISRGTIYNRLNGIGKFTSDEIVALTKVLHLTKRERDEIFLQ